MKREKGFALYYRYVLYILETMEELGYSGLARSILEEKQRKYNSVSPNIWFKKEEAFAVFVALESLGLPHYSSRLDTIYNTMASAMDKAGMFGPNK